MAFSLIGGKAKKRDQVIAIDLGARSTKAVHLQRRGDVYSLVRYCIMDAPIYEKQLSVETLAAHLKAVHQALETKIKNVTIAISLSDSLVRNAELPQIPVDAMRQILRNNTKNYLQQDLPGYTFDCHFLSISQPDKNENPDRKMNAASQKLKVLVGGARQTFISDLAAAVKQAGLIADQITPGIICPLNAFELAQPEAFEKESVALVDIGFKSTSICLVQKGELIVSRVVQIGGDKITSGLAEAMGIGYAEAEGIKIGMAGEVASNLEPLLTPLGRELRASIDFFEHQQDRTLNHVYLSGGSARSEFITKLLETELMAPCKVWNPAANLQLSLPPTQVGELEQIAPQLTVAMGSGRRRLLILLCLSA